ncbi:hypothetical protein C8F01DRAFT_664274 [Mycena amicta]|nr:hypothetical protein C8F01DRAFT_664274 [Mycena amicta]
MPSRGPPRLPTELCERVMDQLYGDPQALGACGLVCWDWIRRSRFLLFSTIHLLSSNWLPLLESLRSPSSTLAFYATDLFLDLQSAEDLHRLVTTPDFGRLSSVKNLRIRNVDFTSLPLGKQAAVERSLARSMKNITSVELHALTFHDLRSCLRLARLFHNLTHLRLVDVIFLKYLEHNIASVEQALIPESWETVEVVSGDAVPAFLHCLLSAKGGHSALNLTLLNVDETHVAYVQRCLTVLNCRSFNIFVSYQQRQRSHGLSKVAKAA